MRHGSGSLCGYIKGRIPMENNTGLQTIFARTITKKFNRAVEEYSLLNKNGDSICVCISGGKDSMLMAALFRGYERRCSFPLRVKYLVMDPGYSKENIALIKQNAVRLGIPCEYCETEIFSHIEKVDDPCFLCSKLRRGYLYSKARELGCNKIALGHHFDDVIESTLMGMIYGGQTQTMMPKLHAQNYPGMELIRPLYFIRGCDIIAWKEHNGLEFLQCACSVTRKAENSGMEHATKRSEIKQLIERLESENPQVPMNIFRSVHSVRLDRIISYKDDKGIHNFMDDYDEK